MLSREGSTIVASTSTATSEVGNVPSGTLASGKRRVVSNSMWNVIGYGSSMAVAFVLTPFVIHRLGNTLYGVWSLVGEITGYMALSDFGMRVAVTRFAAHHSALGEDQQLNRVLSTILFFSLLPLLLIVVVSGAIALQLPHLFSIPPSAVAAAQSSLIIAALTLGLAFPGMVFPGLLGGVMRYDLLNIVALINLAVKASLIWVLLSHGYGLIGVAVAELIATVVSYALFWRFAHSEVPNLAIRWHFVDFGTLRSLLGFSLAAFLQAIAIRVCFLSDNVVVGFVLGPAMVGFYAVATSLVERSRGILTIITQLYAPLATKMNAQNKTRDLQRLFLSGTRIGLILLLPIVLGLGFLGTSFLRLWVGPEFALRTAPVLACLAGALFFAPIRITCLQIVYGLNRQKVNLYLALGEAVLNFLFSVFLIRYLGMLGVAVGTLAAAVPFEGLLIPWDTARLIGVSIRQYLKEVLIMPVLGSIPLAAWFFAAGSMNLAHNWVSLTLTATLGTVGYVACASVFGLNAEEREFIAAHRPPGVRALLRRLGSF